MKPTHTPGPWHAVARTCGTIIESDARNGGPPPDDSPIQIAVVFNRELARVPDYIRPAYSPAARANARLIAASPDLLSALMECVAVLDVHPEPEPEARRIMLLKAQTTIRHATGETQP